MEGKFYEMLEAAPTFGKWETMEQYLTLFHELMKKEIEVKRFTLIMPSNSLMELLHHKLELERDILKAQLTDIIERFDTPEPPPLPPRAECKIRIVPKEQNGLHTTIQKR